jgi:predicted RNase H-like nuclease (RuvC/YqgF family)
MEAVAKKLQTFSEAETARRRAVTGLRNLGREDEADRYDGMSAPEYAEEKGIELVENPLRRRNRMAKAKSVSTLRDENAELKDRISELEDENENLQDQLDQITDIVAPEEEGEDEDLDDGDDDLD